MRFKRLDKFDFLRRDLGSCGRLGFPQYFSAVCDLVNDEHAATGCKVSAPQFPPPREGWIEKQSIKINLGQTSARAFPIRPRAEDFAAQ
jgi:hypothetical protein